MDAACQHDAVGLAPQFPPGGGEFVSSSVVGSAPFHLISGRQTGRPLAVTRRHRSVFPDSRVEVTTKVLVGIPI